MFNPNFKNESLINNEYIPKSLYFNGHLLQNHKVYHPPSPNGFRKVIRVGEENCFTFSFIKISVATTTNIQIRICWKPSQNFYEYTNIANVNNPGSGLDYSKQLIIPENVEEYTIPKNTYKMLILPIQGEKVEIEAVTDDTATSEADCKGLSIRCCFSNNFHNIKND
tara:strand:- start:73 stop:573 length:501 start_codon:yes stop_codon:yes gene_type:complete